MNSSDASAVIERSIAASRVALSGPAAELDRIAVHDAYLSGWFRHETGELFEGFPVHAYDVVLDAGCGDGLYARFCGQQGAEVYIADVLEEKVEAAAKLLATTNARRIHPLVTDCDPLPLSDATVTRVIATEMLEHVDDPKAVMDELVRVARPGALFLITVPDPRMEHTQRKLAPETYFQKPNHLRIFEHDEFEDLVTGAGLVIERRACYGFLWSLWFGMSWAYGHTVTDPWHPGLVYWARAWGEMLSTSEGPKIKKVLDELLPKSQAIIARKK